MQKHHLVERFSSASLSACLDGLAERINRDYEGKNVLLIGILNGAFIFMADLARRLDLAVKMDFVRLSSYGDRAESSGKVKISKDVELPVAGMHVLVVEDIVDTGTTLKWFTEYLKTLGPESVKICALVDKSERREVEVAIDYVGISVESGFLVGYGLDFSEKYRHLPAIYEVVFDNA